SIWAYLLIVPLSNLVQTLPISIAGWGIREGFLSAAFGLVGVWPEKALTLSVLYGLLTLIGSLPGGVIWLLQRRKDCAQIALPAATK
ncbi:MAG TPA: lysylphosphatidylglycerol synthase domain-containing protein, partial [Xanthobacteraceae bacterium]|nr:lysylphosphatidylglycerol synthase domain-containing protein [Xanthobacteraceae bacterium]